MLVKGVDSYRMAPASIMLESTWVHTVFSGNSTGADRPLPRQACLFGGARPTLLAEQACYEIKQHQMIPSTTCVCHPTVRNAFIHIVEYPRMPPLSLHVLSSFQSPLIATGAICHMSLLIG